MDPAHTRVYAFSLACFSSVCGFGPRAHTCTHIATIGDGSFERHNRWTLLYLPLSESESESESERESESESTHTHTHTYSDDRRRPSSTGGIFGDLVVLTSSNGAGLAATSWCRTSSARDFGDDLVLAGYPPIDQRSMGKKSVLGHLQQAA